MKLQYKSDQEFLHEFRKSLSSDQIPFAYLTGGFQLANQNPPDEQLLEDLKTWISPSEDEESDARSRSVKGGFPTGGYHRTKK